GGRIPGTLWLLVGLAAMVLVVEAVRFKRGSPVNWAATVVWCLVLPVIATGLIVGLRPTSLGMQALTTLILITPMGPLLYRLALRPLADATVLMLLIVSVALHGVLVGLGLLFFGAEGSRTPPFSEARFDLGGIPVSGQSLVVL
uniref:hypothetical protein n=1 Tax=Escherichia coli TaxID=562 RepID=UPI00192A442A